ncbi:MAG TPA: ROK family protein, partial [Bryobacteraceae bacterium]|nr:ROK family protein [Bryobacteraceae bacterium]
ARYDPETPFTARRFSDLIRLVRGGEHSALCAVLETAKYLSLGISNIVFALNPEVVIVSGGIAEVWDIVQAPVLAAYSSARTPFQVRPARLPADDLFLHGSISYALDALYAKPKLG